MVHVCSFIFFWFLMAYKNPIISFVLLQYPRIVYPGLQKSQIVNLIVFPLFLIQTFLWYYIAT